MSDFLKNVLRFSGMNNREVIDQVERGYRMAQPSTIIYPESKTLPSEVKIAQANVYKVRVHSLCQERSERSDYFSKNGRNCTENSCRILRHHSHFRLLPFWVF